jgi:alkyldihydroxyacetonephosphate synthase
MQTVEARRRSWWGWGWEDAHFDAAQRADLGRQVAALLGAELDADREPARLGDLTLAPPRLRPPASLAEICDASDVARATHALGKSFVDTVRGFRGEVEHPPDFVARPRDEADVIATLELCASAGAAVVPFGGGTNVVGGVEPDVGDTYAGSVSLDLRGLDRVVEVDTVSRAALVEAGIEGPALEAALRPHGLTLRHYPQSFEFSTLGGWLATRSGGHFATLHTHIDDFVESIRAVTPAGVWESRRLPASGAGPSPDRLLLGSEGTLGVITRAWMRLLDRPRWRASAAVRFPTFESALAGARGLGQSGLNPANCRLLDAGEALVSGSGDGSAHLLLVAFESADHPVEAAMTRALELCRDAGGECQEGPRVRDDFARDDDRAGSGDEGPTGALETWRGTFLRAPYLRDALVGLGAISETFETAVTWDRVESLCSAVRAAAQGSPSWGHGVITTRVTHVYPDGCAPYFTVIAASRHGSQVAQWHDIKAAVSDAILDGGGTITHHHAVGREHRPWYDQQRPEPFAVMLRAAKQSVDPQWILNPGVLVDRA